MLLMISGEYRNNFLSKIYLCRNLLMKELIFLKDLFDNLSKKYGGRVERSKWDHNVKNVYKKISFNLEFNNVPPLGKIIKVYIYTRPINITLNSPLNEIRKFVNTINKILAIKKLEDL